MAKHHFKPFVGLEPSLERACSGQPELFFGPANEASAAMLQRTVAALALCNACSSKDACLDAAVSNGVDDGIWGGVNFDKFHRVNRQNRREHLREVQLRRASGEN